MTDAPRGCRTQPSAMRRPPSVRRRSSWTRWASTRDRALPAVNTERYESSFLRMLRRALVDDARAEIAFILRVTELRARGLSSDEILRLFGAPTDVVRLTGSVEQLR